MNKKEIYDKLTDICNSFNDLMEEDQLEVIYDLLDVVDSLVQKSSLDDDVVRDFNIKLTDMMDEVGG
jgi:hypothetical protein